MQRANVVVLGGMVCHCCSDTWCTHTLAHRGMGCCLVMQQVMLFRRPGSAHTHGTPAALEVQTTGMQPFSVDVSSVGFQLLVRTLASDLQTLGFVAQEQPHTISMQDPLSKRAVDLDRCMMQLIQAGTRLYGGSWVYSVQMQPGDQDAGNKAFQGERAVLKLNVSPDEVNHAYRTDSGNFIINR